MMGRALLYCLSAFLAGGLGLYLASYKAEPAIRHNRRTKFITYFGIVHLVLLSAILGPRVFGALVVVIVSIGAYELYRVLPSVGGGRMILRVCFSVGYLLLGLGLIVFALVSKPETAVFVYLVVAVFDGFSQVAGQLFGKHQLASRISPGKTVEGTLGGLVLAASMAVLLRPLVNMTAAQSLGASGWIILAGLSGDLLASWVKRRGGVKDFGNLLPGHGGVLDRFDSFLLAGPASLLFFHQPIF